MGQTRLLKGTDCQVVSNNKYLVYICFFSAEFTACHSKKKPTVLNVIN